MSPVRLIRPGIMDKDADRRGEWTLTEVATDFLGGVGGAALIRGNLIGATSQNRIQNNRVSIPRMRRSPTKSC